MPLSRVPVQAHMDAVPPILEISRPAARGGVDRRGAACEFERARFQLQRRAETQAQSCRYLSFNQSISELEINVQAKCRTPELGLANAIGPYRGFSPPALLLCRAKSNLEAAAGPLVTSETPSAREVP